MLIAVSISWISRRESFPILQQWDEAVALVLLWSKPMKTLNPGPGYSTVVVYAKSTSKDLTLPYGNGIARFIIFRKCFLSL
jgi:hypothetical protein